ncbi:GspE/PulE family protein [Longitalea arenae]|uniref:GspE/PulE family protein n=1 Tax=Longitalea arenae TaxID=2812558 RepID=UPI00196815BD|nr:GspE/PulE family protein [Longitalea arenae]
MNEPITINQQTASLITTKQAWHYRIVPMESMNGALQFYTDEATSYPSLADELELLMGKKVSLHKINSETIQQLLESYYKKEQQDDRQQNAYYHGDADSFLMHLIGEAKSLRSSDIHIEIFEEKCRVRIRIDGMLVQRYLIDKKQYPSLINKIKITANLDIAEKRLPQDGRIFYTHQNLKFDIRVSILPTLHGEKIVLRLLSNDATNIDINSLGFSPFDLHNYLDGIKRPNGILLISGPTGSGKTTTLYATLKLLNKDTRNITTIEDPIEYTLEGINQVQLKESIGLTFSTSLRTFLRQDPDIIMLGEIRDTETANMAIRFALTGHLVLSTIHTNSAWGIISRLVDMGVAPYLLASTLNSAIAQRLVRLLCPSCKVKAPFNDTLFPRKFAPYRKLQEHYLPGGCDKCFNTGYKGRKAVYEVIPIDEDLVGHIKATEYNVSALLQSKGIKSLSENAFELLEAGETSIDEIYSLLIN